MITPVIPLPASQIHFLNYNYLLDVHFLKCLTTEYSGILKATLVPTPDPVLLIVPEYVYFMKSIKTFTQQVTRIPKVSFLRFV